MYQTSKFVLLTLNISRVLFIIQYANYVLENLICPVPTFLVFCITDTIFTLILNYKKLHFNFKEKTYQKL